MALFKISKGSKANLPTTITEGFCWYTYDDSKFYIDHKDGSGNLVRKALNANDAETLMGASLATILNSSDVEIPTSKAVLDAIDTAKQEAIDTAKEYTDKQLTPSPVTFYDAETIKNNLQYEGTWGTATTDIKNGYAYIYDNSSCDIKMGVGVFDDVVKLDYTVAMSAMNAGFHGYFLIGELNAVAGKTYDFPRMLMASSWGLESAQGEKAILYVANLDGSGTKTQGEFVQTGSNEDPTMSGVSYPTGYYDAFTFTAPKTKTYGVWVHIQTNNYYWRVIYSGGDLVDLSSIAYSPVNIFATKEYVSWNNLADKPFGTYTPEAIIWDGNTEGLETLPLSADHYKILDYGFTKDELVGATLSGLENGEEASTILSTENLYDGYELEPEVFSPNTIATDFSGLFYSVKEDITLEGETITKGFYVHEAVRSLIFPEKVKAIDEQYLPESVVLNDELEGQLNTKVDKYKNPYGVYITDANETTTAASWTTGIQYSNCIPRCDNSGHQHIVEPTNNDHPATKKYVDDHALADSHKTILDFLVSKVGTPNIVFGTDANGQLTAMSINDLAAAIMQALPAAEEGEF